MLYISSRPMPIFSHGMPLCFFPACPVGIAPPAYVAVAVMSLRVLLRLHAKYFGKEECDSEHEDKDQDADRRPEPDIKTLNEVLVCQLRYRLRVVRAAGHQICKVEHANRVDRAEQ